MRTTCDDQAEIVKTLGDGITHEQMRDVVTFYLRDHPDEQQKWMFVLASDALVAAYQCKKP